MNTLNKTDMGSANFAKASADAQKATQASKAADLKFIRDFNNKVSMTPNDVALIEKRSGMTGLKSSMDDIASNQAKLERAWGDVEQTQFGTPEYSQSLNDLNQARANYKTAVDGLNEKLTVRANLGPPSGYDAPIGKTEVTIYRYDAEMKDLEKRIHNAATDQYKNDFQRQWWEAKSEMERAQAQRDALLQARKQGLPAPEMARISSRLSPEQAAQLKKTLNTVADGVITRNPALLQQGGRQLQLIGAQTRELGGDALIRQGRLIEADPEGFIASKAETIKTGSLEANKDELNRIQRQLRNTRSSKIRETLKDQETQVKRIVKKQEEERRKVAVREDVKVDMRSRLATPGQYLPAKVERLEQSLADHKLTSKTIEDIREGRVKPKFDIVVRDAKGKPVVIPKHEFDRVKRRGDISKLATRHNVDPAEVVVTVAKTVVMTRPTSQTQLRPIPAPKPTPANMPETKPAPSPAPHPSPAPKPKEVPSPEPQPYPEPQPAPLPKPEPYPTPTPPITPIPPIPPIRPPGPEPIRVIRRKVDEEERRTFETPSIAPGTIAWEQGRLKKGTVYKIVEPPYTKRKTSVGVPPPGYRDTGDTPASTIQVIGGPAKKDIDVPIGVTTAHVRKNSSQIHFTANPHRYKGKPRNLGAGVVRDRRGQHIRLY